MQASLVGPGRGRQVERLLSRHDEHGPGRARRRGPAQTARRRQCLLWIFARAARQAEFLTHASSRPTRHWHSFRGYHTANRRLRRRQEPRAAQSARGVSLVRARAQVRVQVPERVRRVSQQAAANRLLLLLFRLSQSKAEELFSHHNKLQVWLVQVQLDVQVSACGRWHGRRRFESFSRAQPRKRG